eukprot:TRINITY_DN3501_c1_g1_i1.p1 TRINITY_DN3501_c1_g1~~TRINITY_DN3501_c1_g1_i1.p1  ORF type:complete len:162 (+),score=27.19 TRINITY_DN3501_c1_g1_i1:12-497(+)
MSAPLSYNVPLPFSVHTDGQGEEELQVKAPSHQSTPSKKRTRQERAVIGGQAQLKRARESSKLPSSFIQSSFTREARVPVAKEAFSAVEDCLHQYLSSLSQELGTYAVNERRGRIRPDDVETHLRRIGVVGGTRKLNDVIREHLPAEMVEDLVSVARSVLQ